jgi:hypothetical protein
LRITADIRRQIAQFPGPLPEQQIFNWMVSRDPTPNRQYLGWILSCAIDRAVPFEDIEYLPDTLTKYHERKQRNTLPAWARDINRIKTPSQLDVILRDASDQEITASAEEEQHAWQESNVLLDDDTWLVVIPKSKFAAKYWGRGTEWCTAYGDPLGLHPRRSCQFNEYNNRGPLVVAINKSNPKERYQFHQKTNQYMDHDDSDIGIEGLIGLAKRHSAFISAMTPYLPAVALAGNEKQQLEVVKNQGWMIQYLEDPSEAVQLAAVKHHGLAIQWIQDPSDVVQLAAVRQDGYVLKLLKNPSEALKLAAVKENGHAIKHIDDPSEAVQQAAAQQNSYAIEHIDNPSTAVQLAALQADPSSIRFIKNPSESIQLAVVRQYPPMIQYIKDPSKKTLELAMKQGYNRYGKPIQSPR